MDQLQQDLDKALQNYVIPEETLREIIDEYPELVNWEYVTMYQTLSESFIRKYKDSLKDHWCNISCDQVLSESFIREFADHISWEIIGSCQVLSENFIREFANKLNWNYICESQVLSHDFIEEFKHKVFWPNVITHQNVSLEFVEKNAPEYVLEYSIIKTQTAHFIFGLYLAKDKKYLNKKAHE